jgi:hypothetical protein
VRIHRASQSSARTFVKITARRLLAKENLEESH